jgi:hypothetical protein
VRTLESGERASAVTDGYDPCSFAEESKGPARLTIRATHAVPQLALITSLHVTNPRCACDAGAEMDAEFLVSGMKVPGQVLEGM